VNARFDEAVATSQRILSLWPQAWFGHFFLASNYAATHMSQEAGAECGKVMEMLSGAYDMQAMGMCAWALGAVGQTDEARRLLRIVEHPPKGRWLDLTVMGNAYGAVGDVDRSIAWYQKGMEERAPNMLYMKVGAPWDTARGDPRFQARLRQMNFPG